MEANKKFVVNPHLTGLITGEIQGVFLQPDEEVEWHGNWADGKFIVTGYTIKSKNSLLIIDTKDESK